MDLWFRWVPAWFWRGYVGLGCVSLGIWTMCLVAYPVDAQQGEVGRLLFWHAPAAWACLSVYGVAAGAAALYIWKRSPHADMVCDSCARVARFWATITLVTGMLWGRCTWGTYWVWDARLTTLAVLTAMLYALPLLRTMGTPLQGSIRGAYWVLLGAWNIPLTKASVEWYNTLHQASTVTLQGSAAAPSTTLLLLSTMALVTLGTGGAVVVMMRTHLLNLRTVTYLTQTPPPLHTMSASAKDSHRTSSDHAPMTGGHASMTTGHTPVDVEHTPAK